MQVFPKLSLKRTSLTNMEVPSSTGRTTLPSISEIEMETQRLIQITASRTKDAPLALDSKGGPSGYRPRGYRLYQQLVNDPEFLHLIDEMNREPIVPNKNEEQESSREEEPEITSCPLTNETQTTPNHLNASRVESPASKQEEEPGTSASPPFLHSIITAEVYDEPMEGSVNLSMNKTDSDQGLSDIPSINTSEHIQTSPRAVSFEQLPDHKPSAKNSISSMVN